MVLPPIIYGRNWIHNQDSVRHTRLCSQSGLLPDGLSALGALLQHTKGDVQGPLRPGVLRLLGVRTSRSPARPSNPTLSCLRVVCFCAMSLHFTTGPHHHTPHSSRVTKTMPDTDKLLVSIPTSEFDSPMATRLEDSFRNRVATSVTARTLSSGNHRFYEFLIFVNELFRQQSPMWRLWPQIQSAGSSLFT